MNDRRQTTLSTLHWDDRLLLGYGPIDHIHEEFVTIVNELQHSVDSDLPILMSSLLKHAEQHFSEENRWMIETEFPARECHINEHADVLASIREVHELQRQGNNKICRILGKNLADWFPRHANYLDSALAHWMCKRQFGGKPVVLRRNLLLKEDV